MQILAFFTHISLLLLLTILLFKVYRNFRIRSNNFAEVTGGLYAPLLLLLMYGILPLQSYFMNNDGLPDNELYIVTSFIIISIGAIAYVLGFNFDRLLGINRKVKTADANPRTNHLIIFILLAFTDLYIRLGSIGKGTYFIWMSARIVDPAIKGDPLRMLMDGTGPILVAVAVFLSSRFPILKIYIALLAVMVLLQGSRGPIAYFSVALGLAYLSQIKARNIPYRKIALMALFLFFSYEFVINMRTIFIFNSDYALLNPASFIIDAAGASLREMIGVGGLAPNMEYTGSALQERTLAWSQMFAFQVSRMDSGTEAFGLSKAMTALATVVPSALWLFGEKPVAESGLLIANHFGFAFGDPATTSFSSAYLYGGLLGIIFFSLTFGVFQRFLLHIAIRIFGELGKYLYIGSVAFIIVRANSFASSFVGMRNFLILLICIYLVSIFISAFRRRYS